MMLGSLQWFKLTKNKIPKTMKKLFYLLLMCVSFTLSAQSVKVSTSTNIAIYKGVRYEVYITPSGKLFIPIPTKDSLGYYRKYIKTE